MRHLPKGDLLLCVCTAEILSGSPEYSAPQLPFELLLQVSMVPSRAAAFASFELLLFATMFQLVAAQSSIAPTAYPTGAASSGDLKHITSEATLFMSLGGISLASFSSDGCNSTASAVAEILNATLRQVTVTAESYSVGSVLTLDAITVTAFQEEREAFIQAVSSVYDAPSSAIDIRAIQESYPTSMPTATSAPTTQDPVTSAPTTQDPVTSAPTTRIRHQR
ncbi:hypothetical protein CYMTET_31273 [Cymbomonas tetramitiformis]|uniref:Uncharacterized protein n=1 Tax=Cymbomonas tetramitiformis TaxID=36881 RepID=A0AAE0FI91_9CHLO|nr:hypothetical protein CYMTET_31273 [Cymbomonas tetramitiformis]